MADACIGRNALREISRWRRFTKPRCESLGGEREANDAGHWRSAPRRRRSRVGPHPKLDRLDCADRHAKVQDFSPRSGAQRVGWVERFAKPIAFATATDGS